jgi:group I intron endonuclease
MSSHLTTMGYNFFIYNNKKNMIIYKITNLITGKFYIGKSIYNNSDYFGSGKILKQSIKKYGRENFIKEIIDTADNLNQLNEKEIFWINYYQSQNNDIGYNITKGGEGGDVYTNNPNKEEIREKNIESAKKRKNFKHSEETKQKIREKRKFQKMSEEQKQKLSERWKGESNPGKNKSQETIEKLKEAAKKINRCGKNSPVYGKTHSEETKKHWSEIRKGKNAGTANSSAVRYYIEDPNNDFLIIDTQKEVMKKLGCSKAFFSTKKFKNYKLIKKEKIKNI